MKYLSILMSILCIFTLSNCHEDDHIPPSKPELVSPRNAITDAELNLTFNWNPVHGAKSYSFQLSLSADFSDTKNNVSGIEEVSLTVVKLMPGTKYYWRVNAKNLIGISPWSEVFELTTRTLKLPTLTAPELVSPANAHTNAKLSLTFNWNALSDANSYGFQLSLSSDFTAIKNSFSGIEAVSLSVEDLMPDTKYYWRVNAKNSTGISPWSDIWEFTTQPVGIPTLIIPEKNSIINQNQQTLAWNSVVNADSYTIQVSLTSDFTKTVLNKENHTSLNITITNLEWTFKYYWRVRASINSCNSVWSETWNFIPKRPIPTTGLIAYYPFNGNANDESGNLNTGTVKGASLSNDRGGNSNKAYLFDGVDDYISVPHNDALNLIGNFTLSVWYKSDGCITPCGTYHTIINKRDVSVAGDDWPWGLSISYITGPKEEFKKIIASRRNNLALDYQVSESEIQLNTWQHVVIVVKDNVQSIYIDGKFNNSYSYVQSQPASNKNMLIGWSLRPDLEQFKGLIDDIRLYSRAVTLEEVLALYQE